MPDSSFDLNKTRYTHRDYLSIQEDLINAIPSLTQAWTCREDSDPGIVLIKLISMFGDTLSFNVDKIALELYLQTVTQRKNCATILRLLGYKMHWYRSARVIASVRLQDEGTPTNPRHVVLTPFSSTLRAGTTTYTVIPTTANQGSIDINSSTISEQVYLIEGTVVTVSFNRNGLVNNRYYFNDLNVDESHLWLNFGEYHTCQLVDNLYLSTDDQIVTYEFNVDEYDRPYIELISYWEDILGTTAQSGYFTLRYVRTNGSAGDVSRNTLSRVVGAGEGSNGELIISHPSNNTTEVEDDGWTSPGYDPQTVEEARRDAANYVTTYDTLVTAADFERAARRVVGVTASRLIDNEIILNNDLDATEIAHRAKDDFTTQEYTDDITQETQTLLAAYTAIVYIGYLGFNTTNNYYCSLADSDPYKFTSYTEFADGTTTPSTELTALGAFPYKPTNNILMSINDLYQSSKILNVEIEYGTTKIYPFEVAGTLYLNEPLSPSDTLTVINDINEALEAYYYPDNHSYGEQPRFLDIVRVIQESNTQINYFDATGNITEYLPPCTGLDGFDITSYAIYVGLSSNFNLAQKFLKFRLRNTTNTSITLTNLNSISTTQYTISSHNSLVLQLANIQELEALNSDIQSNSGLIYEP